MQTERFFLVTKLCRPSVSRWHLQRPHLSEILREGLSRRLTALIAAAGHGKTCTLAHFLAQTEVPYLWMQLDPGDSDLHGFARYLARGIRDELGGGSRAFAALEEGGQVPHLLPMLVADLADCPSHVALVLDDFHLIDRDSPSVQLVAGLVQYASQQTHLYICSRGTLPFSIARLKVTQEAAEISEEDLRFTPGEVLVYLKEMAGLSLDDWQLDRICHLTEGWSAALVLLASGLKRRGSVQGFLSGALPADLFTYLTDEVFQSLPPELQTFMEESSILDVCSPQACDALLDRRNSGALLAQLLNSNLLLTQLGPDSFRYHHLLQRFLQERLRVQDGGERFRRLHKRAGDWYLSRELPEEAVQHYLRGEWLDEAAQLVEHLAPLWIRTNKMERLWSLLACLPVETKGRYPWISLGEARHAHNAGNSDVATGLARSALHAFQERGEARGVVQALTLIGELAMRQHQYDSARDAFDQGAAALLPEHRYEEANLVQRRATLAFLTKGAGGSPEPHLRRALSIFVELGDLPGEASVSEQLGVVRANVGDFTSAVHLLERAKELQRSLGEQPYEIGINLAWVYLQLGRFQDAAKICEPMLTSSSRKMRRCYAANYLLYIHVRLGDFTRAAAMAQTANTLTAELGDDESRINLAADLAALYRLSGQPQVAVTYANESLQLSRQCERKTAMFRPLMEVVLLHLFHTGNTAAAARMAEKALGRIGQDANPYDILPLNLTLAVAEFRKTRTESRPDGVRMLQEALAECSLHGYQFFALHEWPLALAVTIYGLAYRVHGPLCLELIRLMRQRLPAEILREGVPIAEPEARLIPAAWQAIAEETDREAFSALLTAGDRRRVVSLAKGPAPLKVHCLGPVTVVLGTEQIDPKALKKRKSGQLLVLLLAQESPLPREQVIDRLWPDLDPEAADTSLRVTLHHLRRLLEPHLGGRSRSRYIQSEGGLIWFSRHPEVRVDLDQFREELDRAESAGADGDPATAALCYEQACRLYRGELAADEPYSGALEDLRRQCRDRYTGAVEWLGDYYWHEALDPVKAISAFRLRVTLDEAYEAGHQALMRIFLENGQVSAARAQYAACRQALVSGLGVEPSRTTESLLQLALSMEREAPAAETRKHARQRAVPI